MDVDEYEKMWDDGFVVSAEMAKVLDDYTNMNPVVRSYSMCAGPD